MDQIKISKSFGLVKAIPAELKGRQENGDTGFWAYCSRETEDTVGDIVRQDGLDFSEYHRPDDGVYLKILAQHVHSLPDGKAAVVGLVKDVVKTVSPYKGKMVKATAIYIEWLRDPATGALLELAAHYKQMVDAGGIDQTSVGMMVTDYTVMQAGGMDIKRATLHEVSLVSVPCLSSATLIKTLKEKGYEVDDTALTVASETDELLKKLLVKMDETPESPYATASVIEECVSRTVSALLEPLIKSHIDLTILLTGALDRLDTLESALVVLSDAAQSQAKDNHQEETDKALKLAIAKLDDLKRFVGK